MTSQNCAISASGPGSNDSGTSGRANGSSPKMPSMATPSNTGGTSDANRVPMEARIPSTNHRRLPWPYR
ncbi:MAG: hypothetical protein J07HX64_02440 [halophilic archaeon J07HX64]|nr:MAG: hypothetical protein J07HX64_02440 [halophilic archaeon J07HX64]